MPRPIPSIIADFAAFTSVGDEYADLDILKPLVEEWQQCSAEDRKAAWPAMFGVFERYPGNAELGIPGPLVGALEDEQGYEDELVRSVQRSPSYYGLWMLNRILNVEPVGDRRTQILDLLRSAAKNASVPEVVRESAQRFLEHQGAAQ